MRRQLKRPAAATVKKQVLKKPASIAKVCKTGQNKTASSKASEPRIQASTHTRQHIMNEMLNSLPPMPSEMFGCLRAESDEERLSYGVDKTIEGLHYFGEDGWGCEAGGSNDEIQFEVDVDFGSFTMPGLLPQTSKITRGLRARGLGNHGAKIKERRASVTACPLGDAFSSVIRLTKESSMSLDPDIKYPGAIPLEVMVHGLGQLCDDLRSQGPKVVKAVETFLGIQENKTEAITVHVAQEGGVLTISLINLGGESIGAQRHMETSDSVEKLASCIREWLGAAVVKLYSGSSEVQNGSHIAKFDILTAQVTKNREALFRATVQTMQDKERSGHIWGDEDPASEHAKLENELPWATSARSKSIRKLMAGIQKQWRGYNDSRYECRDDITIFIHKLRAKKALARVRIAKRVYRDCCCINPFNGYVEL